MHDYNTILGVIELRLSKVSYDSVQKRYRIGRSGIALIMNRYKDSGLSLDDLRQMPASKVVDLIYPKENLRHKDIPLPDFEKIHEQMIQMGKHADLSFLWIDYKKEHPNGYQLAQFYKLYRDFMVDAYGTSKTSMPVERIPGEKMQIFTDICCRLFCKPELSLYFFQRCLKHLKTEMRRQNNVSHSLLIFHLQ